MKKNFDFWLLGFFVLGVCLRFFLWDQLPHGFNADEAAIGYNVYSLLQTGLDEHGHPWPLHFESFADFKPGGYFYLVLPWVKLLGLTKLAVRLPSLLLGSLTVILFYLLIRQLFNRPGEIWLARLGALFLAVSPWHVQFSRGGWETNAASSFLLLGLWLFWWGIRTRHWPRLFFSVAALIFSAYLYHSLRVVAPLLLLGLCLANFRFFWSARKKTFLWLFFAIALSLPLVWDFWQGGALSRAAGVGITGDLGPFWSTNRLRGEHGLAAASWWVKILHNRPLGFAVKFFQNWSSHFGGEFLFVDGDQIRRSHCPGLGQLYYLDFFFLMSAVFFALRHREKRLWSVFFWLLVAPLPAALTLQSPHALRAHSLLFPLLLLSAYGLFSLYHALKKRFRFLLLAVFLFFFSWQVGYFADRYFFHYPRTAPEVWEYGFAELVDYLRPIQNQYRKIYITDRYDQPYILFLFYLRYPPAKFQQEGELTARDKFGFSTVRDFANFHFEAIDWPKIKSESNVLVIGTPEEIPAETNVIHTIYFPRSEKAAFRIVQL